MPRLPGPGLLKLLKMLRRLYSTRFFCFSQERAVLFSYIRVALIVSIDIPRVSIFQNQASEVIKYTTITDYRNNSMHFWL
jgi:hypothetical protein